MKNVDTASQIDWDLKIITANGLYFSTLFAEIVGNCFMATECCSHEYWYDLNLLYGENGECGIIIMPKMAAHFVKENFRKYWKYF